MEDFYRGVKTYTARQAVVSSLALSKEISVHDINLNSNFQKRMIISDFKKDIFDNLKKDKSEYIVIDLIDERFRIAKFEDSIVTYSSCLAESKYLKETVFVDYIYKDNKFYFEGFNIDIFLEEFCRRILEIYENRKIIIHKAKMLDFYRATNGEFKKFDTNILRRNHIINSRINYMYDFFEKKFEKAGIIDICDEFYADENNKWGLAPMHYCNEYYKKAWNIMLKYMKNNE